MPNYDELAQQYGGSVIQGDKIARLSEEVNAANAEADIPISRRFLSELPQQALNVGKEIAKVPFRIGASVVDVPRVAVGKEPLRRFNVPGLGETESYQRTGSDIAASDDSPSMKFARFLGLGSEAVLDIAGAGLAKPAASTVKKGAGEFTESVVSPVLSSVTRRGTRVGEFLSDRSSRMDVNYALDFTSRAPSLNVRKEALGKGSVGYEAPRLFSEGKLKPTPQDVKVAEAAAPYLERGLNSPKRVQKNIDNMEQGIAQTNAGVREMIANSAVPINPSKLKARLNTVKKDNELLFAGDEAAAKAYDAVINEFVSFIGKGKKNTLDLFDGRQAFDSYITGKFPNAFKKDPTGQFVDPKDNIRYNAILDVRRAANEYISDLLPVNNPYRSALRRESYLFDAIKRVAEKNANQIGMNRIQLLNQKYPLLKWAVGSIVGLGVAGGVGTGAAFIGSTN